MLSDIKLLTLARLEKAAIDSGFDVVGGKVNNTLSFRSSQCPLKIWLGMQDECPMVGLSKADVVAELNRQAISVPVDIDGCAGWVAAVDFCGFGPIAWSRLCACPRAP